MKNKNTLYRVYKKRMKYLVGGWTMTYEGRYKSISGRWWYVFTAHGGVFEIPASRSKEITPIRG